MPHVKEVIWHIYAGREFAEDIEFNDVTEDGANYSLVGRTVVVTIGDTAYSSADDAQLSVPTPANGVAEFRLSNADTEAFTGHQYELAVDVVNEEGFTTPYIRGIVSMES